MLEVGWLRWDGGGGMVAVGWWRWWFKRWDEFPDGVVRALMFEYVPPGDRFARKRC